MWTSFVLIPQAFYMIRIHLSKPAKPVSKTTFFNFFKKCISYRVLHKLLFFYQSRAVNIAILQCYFFTFLEWNIFFLNGECFKGGMSWGIKFSLILWQVYCFSWFVIALPLQSKESIYTHFEISHIMEQNMVFIWILHSHNVHNRCNELIKRVVRPGTVCDAFSPSDGNIEEGDCVRKCASLNLTLATESCRERRHVAIKTVRIPELSDLKALIKDSRLNLKVIQLVRDPRGILYSRIETFQDTYHLWQIWRDTGRKPYNLDLTYLMTMCNDFLNSVYTGPTAVASWTVHAAEIRGPGQESTPKNQGGLWIPWSFYGKKCVGLDT